MNSVTEAALWQRVADRRPSLGTHCSLIPQCYRGRRWYVLLDRLSGRHLRLDADAYALLGRLDGQRTVAAAAAQAEAATCGRLRRGRALELLGRLQGSGVLAGLAEQPAYQLIAQADKGRQVRFRAWFANPLTIRLPLFNPCRLLDWLTLQTRRIPLPAFYVVVFPVLAWASAIAITDFERLRSEFNSDLLQPANILLLGCLFPLLKAVHELAHGLVVHRAGGRVNESGISLLVFMPVPYVDASASWAFRSRRTRILVSAAGMMAEVWIAALALCVWYLTQPGMLHEAARGVFLIGTVSTLLFNGNPLLKFDAYYILQDWLEMPNLGPRASAWYRYLSKRYVCGVPSAVPPLHVPGERRWLTLYGFSAFWYRLAITLAIASLLAERYLLPGLLLGLWALAGLCLLPLWRAGDYMLNSTDLAGRRPRTLGICLVPLVLLIVAIAFVPLPSHTSAAGMVWMPSQGQVFAPVSGTVAQVHVSPGLRARAGEVLLELDSAELERDIRVLDAKIEQNSMQIAVGTRAAGTNLAVLRHERAALQAERLDLERQRSESSVRAGMTGVFTVEDTARLAGRYVKAGALLGLMVDPAQLQVRLVVPEALSGRLAEGVKSVGVRLADRPDRLLTGKIERDMPQANNRLPSPALGAAAGGRIVVTGSDASGLNTRNPVVHLHIDLPAGEHSRVIGQRAYVKLVHPPEPLLRRLTRALRRTLLERLPT